MGGLAAAVASAPGAVQTSHLESRFPLIYRKSKQSLFFSSSSSSSSSLNNYSQGISSRNIWRHPSRCHDEESGQSAGGGDPSWDWDRWYSHFTEVDQQESLRSLLKVQLQDAIESEDFQEASRLKGVITEATAKDTVAQVMAYLKKAIEEERYWDAAQIRDDAGAGLEARLTQAIAAVEASPTCVRMEFAIDTAIATRVSWFLFSQLVGWWVGLSEDGNDPYGRIIHISPAQGRFVAKSYSARQLAAAAPGIPLFEIFVVKDGDQGYKQQAVYLKRAGGISVDSRSESSEAIDISISDPLQSFDGGNKEVDSIDISGEVENDGVKIDDADMIEDGLNHVLNFLKDRIPGLKFKILKVIAPEGAEADTLKTFEELMQEDDEENDEDSDSSEKAEDEVKIEGDLNDDKVPIGGDSDFTGKHKEIPVKLVIGGVLQTSLEERFPSVPVRVPARIEYKGRDSFVFDPDYSVNQQQAEGKETMPDWKVATIAAQASADLMPPDVAKVFWNAKKIPVKASKDVKEIIKLAVSQVQKRNGLFRSTIFQRINVAEATADPLNGLYIGAFGPYTSEVVQLRHRYGHWHNSDEGPCEDSKLEFFEYVEAVKLTGDLNVPAGQVTFRAKTGKENRLLHHGIYPEELGVVARYKGQGRMAEPGFHNPQWIDGELVLLGGKGGGHTSGAELGFVYSVPERHFLVLFNRLKLKE